MCHRKMTIAQINELSALLDLGHRDSARVALYFGSMDKESFFWSISETRVLLSKGMSNFCTWGSTLHIF